MFGFNEVESKLDDALYECYCHHWSADYISPHVPTILAMSLVTFIMKFDEGYGIQVAGSIVGHEIEI